VPPPWPVTVSEPPAVVVPDASVPVTVNAVVPLGAVAAVVTVIVESPPAVTGLVLKVAPGRLVLNVMAPGVPETAARAP